MSAPAMLPRHCLVTGANRGLGLEFVRQLLARGDRVIATCRHPGKATALNLLTGEHPGRLHVLPLDVGDPKSIAGLVRELALLDDGDLPLDLLVNNAGVLPAGERFGAVAAADLDDSFRINARGPFLLIQALAPSLAASPGQGRSGATVANISSQLGSIAAVGGFGTPSYAIGKAAQNMATALLARALAERGIAVIALHPGWVQTDMGGAGAQVTPVQSVAGLLAVIDGVTLADSGGFFDYTGGPMAW